MYHWFSSGRDFAIWRHLAISGVGGGCHSWRVLLPVGGDQGCRTFHSGQEGPTAESSGSGWQEHTAWLLCVHASAPTDSSLLACTRERTDRSPLLVCSSSSVLWPLLLPSHFSRVRLCATPQTAAHQAPPALGFSRQEHGSGLPDD